MSACLSGSEAYSPLSPLPSQQKTFFTASACATLLHPLHTSAMPFHSLHTSPPCHYSTPSHVQIGSILGFVTLPLAGLYCATKYAVRSLTEAMGFELAPFGIQVHGLEHPASS